MGNSVYDKQHMGSVKAVKGPSKGIDMDDHETSPSRKKVKQSPSPVRPQNTYNRQQQQQQQQRPQQYNNGITGNGRMPSKGNAQSNMANGQMRSNNVTSSSPNAAHHTPPSVMRAQPHRISPPPSAQHPVVVKQQSPAQQIHGVPQRQQSVSTQGPQGHQPAANNPVNQIQSTNYQAAQQQQRAVQSAPPTRPTVQQQQPTTSAPPQPQLTHNQNQQNQLQNLNPLTHLLGGVNHGQPGQPMKRKAMGVDGSVQPPPQAVPLGDFDMDEYVSYYCLFVCLNFIFFSPPCLVSSVRVTLNITNFLTLSIPYSTELLALDMAIARHENGKVAVL